MVAGQDLIAAHAHIAAAAKGHSQLAAKLREQGGQDHSPAKATAAEPMTAPSPRLMDKV